MHEDDFGILAVDRLYGKGLVSRVASAEDRRIRIVALTPRGEKLIVRMFCKHAADIHRVNSLRISYKNFEKTSNAGAGVRKNFAAPTTARKRNLSSSGDLVTGVCEFRDRDRGRSWALQ